MIDFKACPRCSGDVCYRCYGWGHCLVCGWHQTDIPPEVKREFMANLGKKDLKVYVGKDEKRLQKPRLSSFTHI